MRKKTSHGVLAITGAVMAFASLVDNAQAIPISIQNYLPQAANAHSIISAYPAGSTFAFQSSGLGNYFTSPIPIQNSRYNSWSWQYASIKSSVHQPKVTPAATTVPDGGTTVMMLGGVFCGMALLRKKVKA